MATTTEAAIRNTIAAQIAALTPALQANDKFREHRYDDPKGFIAWATKNPDAAYRMFSVLDIVDGFIAETTNTTEEWRQVTIEVLVAYPVTGRYGSGAAGARNRTEVIRSDQYQIETATGLRGYQNVANATYLVDRSEPIALVDGDGVSFLRGTLVYGFYKALT